MRSPLITLALIACSARPGPRVVTTNAQSPTAQASSEVRFVAPERTEQLTCADPAIRVDGSRVCPDDAARLGLTIVDLRDAWTPMLFASQPDGTAPVYRDAYLALAAGKEPEGRKLDDRARLAELYGVVPSLSIVRERLADVARHACNAAVDTAPIATLSRPYGQDHTPQIVAASKRRISLGKALEKERIKRDLADLAALAAVDASFAKKVERYQQAADLHAGIVAVQQRLVCEGFLDAKHADGSMGWRTPDAVELFQRRNFLMPNERIDEETRDAFQIDSRELDYRLALRILRERIVDATGLIEDGTASTGPHPILGRILDPAPMRFARGAEKPLPNGAPDLIGRAVEAAATELGWVGPDETHAFLARHPEGLRVALALPPVPAYHAPHMELSAVIDRGDVWYDDRPKPRKAKRRPTMTLYVDDGGTKRALVRWPTTIGGWSDVRTDGGGVVQKWKESDVGPRVWRELYAAPTWLPPPTTPDRDLVRNLYNGRWELKSSIMGPGPHGAYGLVLLVHDNVVEKKNGTVTYWDNGIGTHGSSSVTSVVNGTSHGCHRMFNQLAVRLATFLLKHRTHEVKGEQKVAYRRVVRHKGTYKARVDTRGYLYEMTPPVPIVVTKGNIKTARKTPPKSSAPARPD